MRFALLGNIAWPALGAAAFAATAASAAPPDIQGRLTGIVIAATLREAIFVEDGTTRRLRPGDTIDGWTVATVEPKAVTLTADGTTTKLRPTPSPAAETAQAAPMPLRTHQVNDALLRQQREQAEAAIASAKMRAQQAAHHGDRMR